MIDKEQIDSWDYWHPSTTEQHLREIVEDQKQFERDHTTLNQYQRDIEPFIMTEGDDRLIENTLGLVGEAGEVAEKIKKLVRGDKNPYSVEDIKKELGDVLFYVAALSTYFDVDLSEVGCANVEKLNDRKTRGKIHGSGDNR